MNSTFKSVIFTLIGLAIFFAISWLFFSIVPYLLVGGLIIYIIVKIKRYFNSRNNNDNNSSASTYYESQDVQAGYNDDSKVIDVDYKEVKND